jgi:iron(III) transport system substrate-binding protein
MKIKTQATIALLGTISLVAIAGCGNQTTTTETATTPTPTPTTTTAPDAGTINLYSSRHYDSDAQLYAQFTEDTGIKVNLIEGKDDELIERIKSEGANSPADVLITVDIARLFRAESDGILQPITSPVLEAAIPANLRDPENNWFGLTRRARVIIYNTDKVKPEQLSTYEALTEPQWKGKICTRSSGNVYNQSLVASQIEAKGVEATEEWAKGLVANFARPPEGNDTDQIKAVASGQCDLGLVNHYYVARLKSSADPNDQQVVANIGVFFPDQNEDGTHVNISGAGVAVNAPNKDNAVKFLEFLVTPEAQKIFANDNNEYPVISGLEPNETVKAFGSFQESKLNIDTYGKNNAEAVKIMDRVGWK